jgi:hypothetical protein
MVSSSYSEWAASHREQKVTSTVVSAVPVQVRLDGWVAYANKYLLDKATKVKDDVAAQRLYNAAYKSATVKSTPAGSKSFTATLVRNDGKVVEGTFIYLRGGLCKRV